MSLAQASDLYFDSKPEAAKKRIQKLKAAGVIAERPRRVYHPSVLHLTQTGHSELHNRGLLRDYPIAPSFEKRSRVSDFTLRHELAVMDMKAAFIRCARDSAINRDLSTCQVHEFSTWPLLSQFNARPSMNGAANPPEMLVKPDGFIHATHTTPNGQAKHHRFYLEIDRSSEPQETLANRAACYMDHFRRGGLAQRYGQSREKYKEFPFRVLMVFRNAERRNNAAVKMLLLNPPILTLVWLTTMAEAIAKPLGAIWIQPSDYRRAVADTDFNPQLTRQTVVYRRQIERERMVEDRVVKHPLF
jgi:hypothetical protein